MHIVVRISGASSFYTLKIMLFESLYLPPKTYRQTDIYINEMKENFQNTLANLLVVDQLQLEHASLQRLGHIISNSDNMILAKQSESLRYVVSVFHLLGRGTSAKRETTFLTSAGAKNRRPYIHHTIILNFTINKIL